jgi:hypothetical protein
VRWGRHLARSCTTRVTSSVCHNIETGHGGGTTLTSGGSGDGDGGPAVPRATLGYGGAS